MDARAVLKYQYLEWGGARMNFILHGMRDAIYYQHRFLAREIVIYLEALVSCHALLYTA